MDAFLKFTVYFYMISVLPMMFRETRTRRFVMTLAAYFMILLCWAFLYHVITLSDPMKTVVMWGLLTVFGCALGHVIDTDDKRATTAEQLCLIDAQILGGNPGEAIRLFREFYKVSLSKAIALHRKRYQHLRDVHMESFSLSDEGYWKVHQDYWKCYWD